MISLVDLYALRSLDDVGDAITRKIIRSGLSIDELLKLDHARLSKVFTTQKSLSSFIDNFSKAQAIAEHDIDSFESNGISVIHYYDDRYSPALSLIDDFPLFLYCKGNITLLKKLDNIAIIGTRECSEVGVKIARNTALYFAERNYTIVSGLAKGIDAIGHKGALEANGKTIAVLIDVSKVYPKENTELANRILSSDGLLLSENKPNSFQGKNSFVLRDRIQSGLSLAIFPIETDIIGGTMHTVKYAKKQGRLIFVPNILNLSIKAQYQNSVGYNFSKIKGINELIITNQAFPYTKDDYQVIENKLQNLKLHLNESARLINGDDNLTKNSKEKKHDTKLESIKYELSNLDFELKKEQETSIQLESAKIEMESLDTPAHPDVFSESVTHDTVRNSHEGDLERNTQKADEVQTSVQDDFEKKVFEIKSLIKNYLDREDEVISTVSELNTRLTSLKNTVKTLKKERSTIEKILVSLEDNLGHFDRQIKDKKKLSLFEE